MNKHVKYAALSAFSLLFVASVAHATKTNYTATLNGSNERPNPIPPDASTATGSAVLTFDTDTNKLCGKVTYNGLTPTSGHIHLGPASDAGAVFKAFPSVATSPIDVNLDLTNTEATTFNDLNTNPMYVNLHTTAFPSGEIRGQIAVNDAGTLQTCSTVDSGTTSSSSSGSTSSSTSSGTASSSGTSGVTSSSGATVTPKPADDGGCSVATQTGASGLVLLGGLGAVLARIVRRRRNKNDKA